MLIASEAWKNDSEIVILTRTSTCPINEFSWPELNFSILFSDAQVHVQRLCWIQTWTMGTSQVRKCHSVSRSRLAQGKVGRSCLTMVNRTSMPVLCKMLFLSSRTWRLRWDQLLLWFEPWKLQSHKQDSLKLFLGHSCTRDVGDVQWYISTPFYLLKCHRCRGSLFQNGLASKYPDKKWENMFLQRKLWNVNPVAEIIGKIKYLFSVSRTALSQQFTYHN